MQLLSAARRRLRFPVPPRPLLRAAFTADLVASLRVHREGTSRYANGASPSNGVLHLTSAPVTWSSPLFRDSPAPSEPISGFDALSTLRQLRHGPRN